MIWPFDTEAHKRTEEDRLRKKREVEEISREIRRLSKQIVDSLDEGGQLIPLRRKNGA